jgi:hypothetical protein
MPRCWRVQATMITVGFHIRLSHMVLVASQAWLPVVRADQSHVIAGVRRLLERQAL